jgi:hypothetical protein
MAARVRKISALSPSATPRAIHPKQNVATCIAFRASEPRPDPALASVHSRHRPVAQNNLNLDAAAFNHHDLGAGPGKARMEGVGKSSNYLQQSIRPA